MFNQKFSRNKACYLNIIFAIYMPIQLVRSSGFDLREFSKTFCFAKMLIVSNNSLLALNCVIVYCISVVTKIYVLPSVCSLDDLAGLSVRWPLCRLTARAAGLLGLVGWILVAPGAPGGSGPLLTLVLLLLGQQLERLLQGDPGRVAAL